MAYYQELLQSGNRCFRWRSYIPFLFLGPLLLATRSFSYLGDSHALDLLWEGLCLSVSLIGLLIRCHVVGHAPAGTSGRNTKRQMADELTTTGFYSVTRHPLYLGNLLMWVGVAMFLHDGLVVLAVVVTYWIYYERIVIAEEAFLADRYGAAFEEWARRTPVFLPRLTGWKAPREPFSLRNVLRREHSGLFAVVTALFALELLGDRVEEGVWTVDPVWATAFGVTALVHWTLRYLKNRTDLLRVEGR